MGLPGKRRTKSSKMRRAAHFAMKKTKPIKCAQCGKPALPHQACAFCGTYRGRQILEIKIKKKTTKQKAQERREKQKEKAAAK